MFLIKIFKFLKGYVIITLRGFFIERFINICTRRNIKLWDIKKSSPSFATMKISVEDFKKIRSVARKTHTKIKIRKKCGFKYFVKKYKRRYALFLGIAIFISSCVVFPQFIWVVDIEGYKTIDKEEIALALRDVGVYAGAYKGALKTPQQIRDIIMSRFDNITWSWIYINGSHALMRIEEKAAPPEITDKTIPGNIVAVKDGVISRLIVKEGAERARVGEAVSAGDILISGEVETKDGSLRRVHALGEAEAFTYYNESRDVKLYDEVRTPTGKEKLFCTLNIFSKNINLFLSDSISYDEYDTINNIYTPPFHDKFNIPVSLSVTKAVEVGVTQIDISEKIAAARAREMIEDGVSNKILPGSELIKTDLYTEKIDDDTLRVRVQMEFKEKIGLYQPMQIDESDEDDESNQDDEINNIVESGEITDEE